MNRVLDFLIERVGKEEATRSVERLEIYRDHILKWNENVNLTAINTVDEFNQKHILDSLLAYDCIKSLSSDNVVDIGTGGGFPGVPLAILFPEKNFVLIDSLKKRLKIIDEGSDLIGLTNITTLHGRAEDFGRSQLYRDNFDLAVSRAVANMSVLAEFCLPLVRPGGHFIAYKGPEIYRELEFSNNAISLLKGQVKDVISPFMQENSAENDLEHVLLLVEKIEKTPKAYPRKAGTPSKKPL